MPGHDEAVARGKVMDQIVTDKTLVDTVRRHAAAKPNAVAFHFEGRDTTYEQFDRNTNKVGNALLAADFKPGDRICFLGKNSDHFFELMYGAMKVGMVMTPVNWRLAPPEMIYIINNAEAPVLFVGVDFAAAARAFKPQLSALRLIVGMDEGDVDPPLYTKWRDAQPDTPPKHAAQPADVAVQLYTSGTTGHPKGAMLSHANLLNLTSPKQKVPDWNRWNEDDVTLVTMPVFHIAGAGWGMFGLFYGAKNVVMRDFDPGAVLDYIQKYPISKCILVPAALQFVVRHPKARQTDYSRLKYMIYGASPIPLELLKECMTVFGCGFVQMYGMTETTGGISILDPEDHIPEGSTRMRSAGKAMEGVEFAILDADGNRLPTGEVGEIATRSKSNMVGYWKMDEATRATISDDNWLRTGDAGYIDADGYIYIQDRIKDMIISGGENIYPAEVENAVFGHPAVAEVAVIGVPDDRWGESVRAVVVKKPGAEVSPDEIIAYARERIAAYKSPKAVDFIDVMPRNASGKILRRQLREPYWEGKSRRVN
jgi:acyl-CoA synthetase (AMP-forming)/AMP-acid ligase II